MLTTVLKKYDAHLIFVVKINDDELLSFEFPKVDHSGLDDFLREETAETQDDDGFHMQLEHGTVHFTIQPSTDGGDHEDIKLSLPLDICRKVLFEMTNILKTRYHEKYGSDEDN